MIDLTQSLPLCSLGDELVVLFLKWEQNMMSPISVFNSDCKYNCQVQSDSEEKEGIGIWKEEVKTVLDYIEHDGLYGKSTNQLKVPGKLKQEHQGHN